MFAIVLDSTSSTPTAELKAKGVAVVPLTVRFGEEEYIDGETMMPEEFFRRMAEYMPQGLPKTSCPAPGKFEQAFREAAQGCEGVLCVTLSSGLSDTCHSAALAAEACAADGIHVEVIDSLSVTQTNSMMAEVAIKLRDSGATLDEAAAHLREMAVKTKTIVALDQLENLVKGGRVGRAAGVAASILNLKPVLVLDDEGIVETACKSRGVKGLIRDVTNLIKSYEEEMGACEIRMAQANAFERAEQFEKSFVEAGLTYNRESLGWIGSVIGTYSGEKGVLISVCPKSLL